eukprot:Amastigsp_a512500_11.p3 type:complete len:120 gc:universal Amastigsp_a512500_11:666-307(-)
MGTRAVRNAALKSAKVSSSELSESSSAKNSAKRASENGAFSASCRTAAIRASNSSSVTRCPASPPPRQPPACSLRMNNRSSWRRHPCAASPSTGDAARSDALAVFALRRASSERFVAGA